MTLAVLFDDPVEAEAAAFEVAAIAEVTGTFAEQVGVAVAAIVAARAAAEADGTIGRAAILPVAAARRVARVAVEVLRAIIPSMRPALERQAAIGVDLGRRHAIEADGLPDEIDDGELPEPTLADTNSPDFDPPDDGPELDLEALADADPEIAEVIESIDIRAQERLDDAVHLAETLPMSTKGDVDDVATQAMSAVHGARRDVAWVAERAQSIGALAESEETGDGGLLWISERDSCLACLALSGQVAYGGETFTGEDFGDHPFLPVPYPPAHPNCRCRVRPYDGPPPERDLSALDPASALAREARRSVLRGWSAYDSEAARLRAAERLANAGADLPKSVVDRARRNLADGEFSSGRFPQR